MVAAHANSLRSIIMYLDKMTSQEVACCCYFDFHYLIFVCGYWLNKDWSLLYFSVNKQVTNLELSTGIPLLYIYKDGRFSSRGSPVGPTEAGVYAYTEVSSLSMVFVSGSWIGTECFLNVCRIIWLSFLGAFVFG